MNGSSVTRVLSGIILLGHMLVGCSTFEENNLQEIGQTRAPLIAAPADKGIPGQYLVVFHDDAAKSTIAQTMNRTLRSNAKNQITHEYNVIPGFVGQLTKSVVAELTANPAVAYIAEDRTIALAAISPSPASGIDRTDQRRGRDGFYNDHGRDGAGVRIYVVDSGINTQHTEFTGRIGSGASFVNDGNGIEDCNGHGTHVSSTAVGTLYGMAKKAQVHPVRVADCQGVAAASTIIAGIDFAVSECSTAKEPCVINVSLSDERFGPLNDAVTNAVDAGVFVAVAAGNNTANACSFSPSSATTAVAVGAIDENDSRAADSNFGFCVDVFAPGVSILGAFIGSATATAILDGTSTATAHVAGAAAQIYSANPSLPVAQVESFIKTSASLECLNDARGPNVLLFTDFNQGNFICDGPAPSCEGLCGGASDGCFCDLQCAANGDCCTDFDRFCTN